MAPAKQKAVVNTHPNVFDLESAFITVINHKNLELHTSTSNVRTGKKKETLFSALLNKSDDPYCGHTQLWPKPQLAIFTRISPRQKWKRGFSLRWQKWTRESLSKDVSIGSVTSGILKLQPKSILWGEQQKADEQSMAGPEYYKGHFWITATRLRSLKIAKLFTAANPCQTVSDSINSITSLGPPIFRLGDGRRRSG